MVLKNLVLLIAAFFALASFADDKKTNPKPADPAAPGVHAKAEPGASDGAAAKTTPAGDPADHHATTAVRLGCPANDTPMSKAQLAVMVPMEDPRDKRLPHVLWHMGSDGEKQDFTDAETEAFGPGWVQPQKMCKPSVANNPKSPDYNHTGESFFYMHRGMRNRLNDALTAAKLPCVGGWTHVPQKDDKVFPVPRRPGNKDDLKGAKGDDALAMINEWFKMFKNKYWLAAHSLGELGWFAEKTVHNSLHMRMADEKKSTFNTNFPLKAQFLTDLTFPVGWNSDGPANDYLGDPYGSHVNAMFWKLHGMMDDLVDKWGKSQTPPITEFAENCGQGDKKRTGCYQWQGTWTGGKFPDKATLMAAAALPEHPEAAKTRALHEDKISKHPNRFFKTHIFDEDVLKDFKNHPGPQAMKAAAAPVADPELAEYQQNKDKWLQMEKVLKSKYCPPA